MRKRVLIVLALLAIVAYLPTLSQPFIEDDFPNIAEAHALGLHIISDPIFGIRSTSFLLMDGLYRLFRMHAAPYYAASILLHVLNTWLLYALGYWRPIGYTASAWAAGFFAVYEGHQEGIMWLSGSTEPLLFVFGVAALICWLHFLYEGRWTWYVAAIVVFVPALYSKESAFILVALFALPVAFDRRLWPRAGWLAPFTLMALAAIAHVLYTRTYSFRFNDRSFSFHAPVWITLPNSFARLLWFWGLAAIIVLVLWRPPTYKIVLAIGLTWSALSLVPYSFLLYATRVPSRQTYLASAGLALIVGCALATLAQRYWASKPAIVAAVAAIIVIHNVGYLWIKKRAQFLERAAPTDQLISFARTAKGPIYVRCFPRPPLVGDWAVRLTTGRQDLIWDASQVSSAQSTFCYSREHIHSTN